MAFCRDNGVIVGRSGGGARHSNTIVLSPPLIITRSECDRLIEAILLAAQTCEARLVGRAALGTMFVELETDAVASLREQLAPGTTATVLDAPDSSRAELDPWGVSERAAVELMRRIKARFDPAGTCNPGLFVDRI